MDIRIKRVHGLPAEVDGTCVLVDGLWPRGISKADLEGVRWMKQVAASAYLRAWFDHDAGKWAEFKRRYGEELDRNPDAVRELRSLARRGRLTLLYAARDEAHNNAVALRDYLLGQRPEDAA
jgi:uncharacterized protein YeaO (DUF488 family)